MSQVHFMLGSDPELMLREKESKKLRSAIPVILEGKGEGKPIDAEGKNLVLHDNVLVEFNTEPAANAESFVTTIGKSLRGINAMVAKDDLEIWLQASADYPPEELEAPEARAFGCEPDFDAYRLEMNQTPLDAAENSLRSAGGHLHIGFHDQDQRLKEILQDDEGKIKVIQCLDLLVGVPSIFLDKDPTAKKRRSLYGKAGCHRPKEYGVEYRAVGNWWLASPKHTEVVYSLSEAALSLALKEGEAEALFEALGGQERVQEIINESLVTEAKEAYDMYLCSYINEGTREMISSLAKDDEYDFHTAWGL